jgi:thiamine-monophosphate kinase
MEQPTPRVALGLALRGVASAVIDVSDGLLGDLRHILKQSGVAACIQTEVAATLMATPMEVRGLELSPAQRLDYVLAGGDDYELLFTAPVAQRAAVQAAARESATRVTRIGAIEAGSGVRLLDGQGKALPNHYASFDHFA